MINKFQEAYPSVTVLPATAKDSHNIWQWRNDELTKQMSISSESATWESHSNWYEKTLANPCRHLYIGYLSATEKIGMCRFDVDSKTNKAEVSINLNPEYRNKKLSAKLLAESIKKFRGDSDITLTATIKKINIGSIKCFASIGFVFKGEDADCNYYEYCP